jgi:pSer/pThr/pTyr-binding forkhead associated (FHA) protein
MVQLKILSGKMAGASFDARRFPVRVGRSAQADLRLEDEGVWDRHLRLEFNRDEGVVLHAEPNALATVNGQPLQAGPLRNGDLIQIGSATLQFWLAEARQTALGLREMLTWLGIAAVCLGQIALIYWVIA